MTALTAVPDQPDTRELSTESSGVLVNAQQLAVTDAQSYAAAGEFGKSVRALQKKITEFFEPHKKRAHSAWRGLCDEEAKQLAPTEAAVKLVAMKMTTFKNAEEKRLDAERRQREDQARKLEEDRRLQEALDREADGDHVGANEIINESAPIPFVPMREAAAPKVLGVATTKRWTFELQDLAAVVRHVAGVETLAHPELLNLLELNTTATRQLVTAMRENFGVPGIRAYQTDGVSFGSK